MISFINKIQKQRNLKNRKIWVNQINRAIRKMKIYQINRAIVLNIMAKIQAINKLYQNIQQVKVEEPEVKTEQNDAAEVQVEEPEVKTEQNDAVEVKNNEHLIRAIFKSKKNKL